MRAFAACLSVVLGLGAFSVVACSSDATTTAAGGEAGEAPAVGGGGMTSTGGATAEGGASSCTFDSDACAACLQGKCATEAGGCVADDACGAALSVLEGCACDASKTIDECKTAFGQSGGDPAAVLVTCYDANCMSACQ